MRTLIGITVLWWIVAAQSVAGQTLYDGGIRAAAAVDGIRVNAWISGDNDRHCTFNARVLEAEAERTLRRDGITTRRESPAVLSIEVVMLPEALRRCAVKYDVDLVVVFDAEQEILWLAAEGGGILGWPAPGHVGEVRRSVEEIVSVIANAVRRARDELLDQLPTLRRQQ